MAKNKVLSSPHQVEIHERLASGERPDDVSEWLLRTHNEKISARTLRRYSDNHIHIKTKVQASYNRRKANKRKAQRKAQQKEMDIVEEKIAESKAKDKETIEQITDKYTESVVDALEILDSWIPRLSNGINLDDMSEYQKFTILCKMLDIKLKYTMGSSEEDDEFNILDVFKAEIKVIK